MLETQLEYTIPIGSQRTFEPQGLEIFSVTSLVEDRIEAIRQKYNFEMGSDATAVNILLDLAKIDLLANPENGLMEVVENLHTSVVEKVVADVFGKQDYQLQIAEDDHGLRKVKFGMGWATDIYEKSLNEDNSQLPRFEIQRNAVNLRNLHMIEQALQNGQRGIFVEFSPSPDITYEAKQRGYDGRDCIFFYHIDPDTNQVKVEQFWFQATDRDEYMELFGQQDVSGTLTDIDIMNQSMLLEADDGRLQQIKEFIDAKSINSTQRAEIELESKLEAIHARAQNLINSLRNFARTILIDEPDLSAQIRQLNDFIFNEQLRIRFELWEKGCNTLSKEVESRILGLMHIAGNDIVTMGQVANFFVADGCGFSLKKGVNVLQPSLDRFNPITNTMNNIPRSNLLFSLSRPSRERPDACNCKNHACPGKTFYVKNGDSSTYFENCPYCGENMKC